MEMRSAAAFMLTSFLDNNDITPSFYPRVYSTMRSNRKVSVPKQCKHEELMDFPLALGSMFI